MCGGQAESASNKPLSDIVSKNKLAVFSDGDEIINSISIDYSLNNADHLPVCIDLALQRIPEIVVDNSTRQRGLAWDKINDDLSG